MLFYIAARPQTIVSLVNTGRFPDQLPDWIEPKVLTLFEKPDDAVNSIKVPELNQLFLMQIELPESERTNMIKVSTSHLSMFQMAQIATDWIQKVITRSKNSEKLLRRLLNDEITVGIEVNAQWFDAQKVSNTPLVKPLGFSRSFASLAPLNTHLQQKAKIVRQGDMMGSTMQTLINTINCVGVMGKGIALLFKEAYPEMFKDYQIRCQSKLVKIGQPYLFRISDARWILNFPTKDHWRNNSNVEYIEEGLRYLADHYREWGITSLAVPPLGCGNGGLSWETQVQPLVQRYLFPLDIPIEIYTPFENSLSSKKRTNSSDSRLVTSAVGASNSSKDPKKQKFFK